MIQLLTPPQQRILRAERQALAHLQAVLARLNASANDQEALSDALLQLDDFFLLVIVGEFNAGKSALINALLGKKTLQEGVTPTTTQVQVLRYGQESGRHIVNQWLHEITAPADLLREISLVDTPGVNAIVREHEEITLRFLPRADLVLFVTSADRPFTESERRFLQTIRNWGKKLVAVINKTDILQNEAERQEVSQFVRQNVRQVMGVEPEVFPVSARLALQGKDGDETAWAASGFAALETYIHQTLDAAERLRLKFSSPLGVAEHLVARYQQTLQTQLHTLDEDLAALENIESQIKLYQEDMQRGFEMHMADIDNSLYQMALRGTDYFASTLRLGRLFDLLDKQRIQLEFEHQVVADTPQEINEKIHAIIDWLISADLKQWQAINQHLAERKRAYEGQLIGGSGQFQYDRQRLLDNLGQRAERALRQYDKAKEAAKLAESAQAAVTATAALEIGAIGLGAVLTAVATTAAADATGILLAGTVATLGLFVIPARRRRAEAQLKAKLQGIREDLNQSLRTAFSREIQASITRIEDILAPYARFVRGENQKLGALAADLQAIQQEIGRLRAEIGLME